MGTKSVNKDTQELVVRHVRIALHDLENVPGAEMMDYHIRFGSEEWDQGYQILDVSFKVRVPRDAHISREESTGNAG